MKKLKWRPNRSAIVIFSDSRNQKIEVGGALQNGAVSAVDAFGRYLGYETKDFCDVVVVRKANTHQIFDSLGYKNIIDYSRQFIWLLKIKSPSFIIHEFIWQYSISKIIV